MQSTLAELSEGLGGLLAEYTSFQVGGGGQRTVHICAVKNISKSRLFFHSIGKLVHREVSLQANQQKFEKLPPCFAFLENRNDSY